MQGRTQDFKLGGAHLKIFGVFRVKNHDFTPTKHIFSYFRGGPRRVRPAPAMIIIQLMLDLSVVFCHCLVYYT
jgi:hypothetical protein